MSDLKINEFRERAERGLGIPDLAVIERQGRALRRRRVAAAAGGLAVVLVAGLGITGTATNGPDTAPAPVAPSSPTPTTTSRDEVRNTLSHGESVLLPGPATVTYDGVTVRFDVPGDDWEWWDVGMGLRRTGDDPDDYGAAVFFLRDASARLGPCSDDRAQALGADPDQPIANVAPLLDLAHATVLQEPRVVTAFGGTAVHLQLQTKGSCPEDGDLPAQLRGMLDGEAAEPGWGGSHRLDVWHVVVPGPEPAPMLVASWDLDGTSQHHAQRQALLDSLRIEAE